MSKKNKLLNIDKITLYGSLSSIISLSITVVAAINSFDAETIFGEDIYLKLSFFSFLLFGTATLCWTLWKNRNHRRKIDELRTKVQILEKHSNDGIQITKNAVTIIVDTEQKIYNFSFEKHFEVISDESIKWYKCQFYCNRNLIDIEKTKNFYEENTPSWKDLNVFANLRFCRLNEREFSKPYLLKIEPITDKSYYIPFHILYEHKDKQGADIALSKGTRIILNYGYRVSANIWGSYLNRSMSYFAEEAEVILKYPYIENPSIEVTLSRLDPKSGKPHELKKYDHYTNLNGNMVTYEIKIPKESLTRFRVWWDSFALMGIEPTVNDADQSKMTDY